jgi:acyl carrier protein
MGERLLATEPLLGPALAELTGDPALGERNGLAGLAAHRAGALAALGTASVLRRLGLTFSRVDAPDWAGPAAKWLTDGADPESLAAALDACTGGGADAGSVRERVGQVLIGPEFDLTEVVAAAWRAGVAVDWSACYRNESRARIPLPTYPFTRRRFWLERPQAQPNPAGREPRTSDRVDAVDIADYVEKVWREVLGVQNVPHDAHFVDDLGGDSLYAVEVGARLNEGFSVDLPVDLPFIAPTVAATADFVEKALAMEATS